MVTFHVKGLLTLGAFAGVLLVAGEPRLGILAAVAVAIVEALTWGRVFGFGRGEK